MPEIAFFLPSLKIGGAEKVVVNLVNEFQSRGYDAEILVAERNGELEQEVHNGVEIKQIKTIPFPGYSAAGYVPGVIRYLRNNRPRYLYTGMNHINVPLICAWKLSNVSTKLIISEHNTPSSLIENSNKNRIVYSLAELLYPKADEIIAVSDGVKYGLTEIVGVPEKEITRIYNPIVSDDLLRKSKEQVDHSWFESDEMDVILNVANMRPQKKLDDLIRAFSLIQNKSTRLALVGDGPEREQLEEQCRLLGIEDRVEFFGYVENPYKYMRSASVFVLSSRWEGFGNVLVEAMACGCPVISTDCPTGPREILADGKYGTLVPVGEPKMMADTISETLSGDELPNVRDRASDFSVEAIATQYESVMENVVSKNDLIL
jgi:glycosyltransferase involved in cell wall biosynthesis